MRQILAVKTIRLTFRLLLERTLKVTGILGFNVLLVEDRIPRKKQLRQLNLKTCFTFMRIAAEIYAPQFLELSWLNNWGDDFKLFWERQLRL